MEDESYLTFWEDTIPSSIFEMTEKDREREREREEFKKKMM
jgi:hypothetical protein